MTFDFEHSHNVKDAVIYCRVSSKSQTTRGDGLASQQTRCRAYADYKGYNVKKVFADDLTGRSSTRPGLNNLISYLQSNPRHPHVVIVDDLSRFARSVPVHFKFRKLIADSGGILESPTIELRDDADGELHEYLLASVAQHQSRKNAEQTANRTRARLMNGYAVYSQPPKGYKFKLVKGRGKMLFRDDPLASIIQQGLEGYASGYYDSQSEVVRYFESQPVFPKDLPNGKIRQQRVADILRHPFYAGYLEAPKLGISFRKAQHEGIISLEIFQKIQSRLKSGARAPARKDLSVDFPLRNYVLCADCKKPLTAGWSKSKTGKMHPYYRCQIKKCESNGKSIRRAQIEGDFEALLLTMQPSNDLFSLVKIMINNAGKQRTSQIKEVKSSLKHDLTKIDKQISKLLDRIIESENATVIKAYENKIGELERQKLLFAEKIDSGGQKRHPPNEIIELAMNFLGNPHRIWVSGHIHLKRLVLRLGFKERITYHSDNGFLNPKKSFPFKVLDGGQTAKCKVVPRERIELSTSPLPRVRSTTEPPRHDKTEPTLTSSS